MADISHFLAQEAQAIAQTLRQRSNSLDQQHRDLLAKLKEVERQRELLAEAPIRASTFLAELEAKVPDFPCPKCWVADGVSTAIKPQSSSSDDIDIFGCKLCGETYEVPV